MLPVTYTVPMAVYSSSSCHNKSQLWDEWRPHRDDNPVFSVN